MNSDSPILPHNYHGSWTVLNQAPRCNKAAFVKDVRIARQEDSRFQLEYIENGEQKCHILCYVEKTDCLGGVEYEICVSFWRNPSEDIIFVCQRGKKAWVARRKPKEHDKAIPDICREWNVAMHSGKHAAKGHVRIIPFHGQYGGPENLKTEEPGLFGLYQVDKSQAGNPKLELYDVLAWDHDVRSFNSIFRVRSLTFWPGSRADKKDDCIFATFDSRFVLPASRFGNASSDLHTLGQLMGHESGGHPAPQGPQDDPPPDDPEDDPDTGIWVGTP